MGSNDDKICGFVGLSLLASFLSYYVFLIIIVPFIDKDHYIHKYFPPPEYVFGSVALAGTFVLVICLAFVGIVLLRSAIKIPESSNKIK